MIQQRSICFMDGAHVKGSENSSKIDLDICNGDSCGLLTYRKKAIKPDISLEEWFRQSTCNAEKPGEQLEDTGQETVLERT